jgi:hypothetical protein
MKIKPLNKKEIRPSKNGVTGNPLAIGYRLLAIA